MTTQVLGNLFIEGQPARLTKKEGQDAVKGMAWQCLSSMFGAAALTSTALSVCALTELWVQTALPSSMKGNLNYFDLARFQIKPKLFGNCLITSTVLLGCTALAALAQEAYKNAHFHLGSKYQIEVIKPDRQEAQV